MEKPINEQSISKEDESPGDVEKLQIGFWNVGGIVRQPLKFYDHIKTFDFIGLVETWLEEKEWKNIKELLSEEFNLKVVYARRTKLKGRAKGGIITGVKKHLQEEEEGSHAEMDNAQERIITVQGRRIKILTVYVPLDPDDRENIWKILKEYKEEDAVIIGGDFNARTGEKSAMVCQRRRQSQDKMTNKAGRELLAILGHKKWSILNGATAGDENGNFTFVGARGNSVIDYAVVNGVVLENVECFEVEDMRKSDHQPIKVTLKMEKDKKECNTDKEIEALTMAIRKL